MLSRRLLLASGTALAAGCSFAEPSLDAPSVAQETALNVAASAGRHDSFGDPSIEEPEKKYGRAAAKLETDTENPYGPARGGFSFSLRFYERLVPLHEGEIKTQEEAVAAHAAALDAAAALLENLAADLVTVSQDEARWLGEEGTLLPLDWFSGQMGAELEREFFPGALDGFRSGGALYALPLAALPLMLYYDEEYFAQQGVPPVDASWNWDDLVANAVKLTTREADGTVARWGLIAHQYRVWWALWQNGAEAVDPETLQCRLQEPAALEALQFVRDLTHTHRVSPPVSWRELWVSGLIWRPPPAMLYSYSPDSPSNAFRMASLPRGKARAVPVQADLGLAIAARTPQPEAAYTALRGLTQALQAEVTVPASKAAVARLADIRADLRPEEIAAIQDSLEHGRAWPQDLLQLYAMQEVMDGLGRGEDLAALVNSACSVVGARQQA